jgi:hypothetical protein
MAMTLPFSAKSKSRDIIAASAESLSCLYFYFYLGDSLRFLTAAANENQ